MLAYLHDRIEQKQYYNINLLNKNYLFFCPSAKSLGRMQSILEREPETINWIKSFKNKKKIIFWDIGANTGLYSIYAAIYHKDIEVISFEPSTSNQRVLSRNISINNLHNHVKIFQPALTEKKISFHYLVKQSSLKEIPILILISIMNLMLGEILWVKIK